MMLCLWLALSASGLSGCIAGAATDSRAHVYQVRHYGEYLAPSVRKASAPLSPGSRVREARPLLFRFEDLTVLPQAFDARRYTPVGGAQVAFYNKTISVKQAEDEIIAEQLPEVFYFGDLEVARHTVGKERLWLLLGRSRQSTSMYWLGVYDSRGKALYRAVLPFHKVWSLEPFAEGVQINGSAYAERVIIVR